MDVASRNLPPELVRELDLRLCMRYTGNFIHCVAESVFSARSPLVLVVLTWVPATLRKERKIPGLQLASRHFLPPDGTAFTSDRLGQPKETVYMPTNATGAGGESEALGGNVSALKVGLAPA